MNNNSYVQFTAFIEIVAYFHVLLWYSVGRWRNLFLFLLLHTQFLSLVIARLYTIAFPVRSGTHHFKGICIVDSKCITFVKMRYQTGRCMLVFFLSNFTFSFHIWTLFEAIGISFDLSFFVFFQNYEIVLVKRFWMERTNS